MSDHKLFKAIATPDAPSAIGPYSQGFVSGDLLFISGQLPLDPETGEFVAGGIEEMTHQVIKNTRAIAQAAGTDLNKVVKTTVFLTDMANFAAVNKVYDQYFSETLPSRAVVQVTALPKGGEIEMESIVQL
jgi:2-iminobutanoate/2-iminopropanoate deaminase